MSLWLNPVLRRISLIAGPPPQPPMRQEAPTNPAEQHLSKRGSCSDDRGQRSPSSQELEPPAIPGGSKAPRSARERYEAQTPESTAKPSEGRHKGISQDPSQRHDSASDAGKAFDVPNSRHESSETAPFMVNRVERIAISSLKVDPRNARKHPPEQAERLAAAIGRFGFYAPVVVDEADRVIAGHGRLMGAKARGMTHIPCVRLAGLTS